MIISYGKRPRLLRQWAWNEDNTAVVNRHQGRRGGSRKLTVVPAHDHEEWRGAQSITTVTSLCDLYKKLLRELINYALRIVSIFPFLLGTFHWNELLVPFDFQPNFRFSFFVQMANAPTVTCSQAFFRAWYSHWFHCAKSLVRLFRS